MTKEEISSVDGLLSQVGNEMKRMVVPRNTILPLSIMLLISITLYAPLPSIAQYQDVPTTSGLNPAQVKLVVNADSKFQKTFTMLAMKDLERAGIYITPRDKAAVDKLATLLLTIKQEPLHDVCPGGVSYTAHLALIEDVVIERSGQVVKHSTWSSSPDPQIRHPLSDREMEVDIHALIERFIVNFKLGNTGKVTKPGSSTYLEEKRTTIDSEVGRWIEEVPSSATLRNLNFERVNFRFWAGPSTKDLHDRALRRAAKAGVQLKTVPVENTNPELTLDLMYETVDEVCAGKGIYLAKLELSEQVKILRSPGLYFLTTTWSRQINRVSEPPLKEQLQMDSDELLDQFIAAYKSDNGSRSNRNK